MSKSCIQVKLSILFFHFKSAKGFSCCRISGQKITVPEAIPLHQLLHRWCNGCTHGQWVQKILPALRHSVPESSAAMRKFCIPTVVAVEYSPNFPQQIKLVRIVSILVFSLKIIFKKYKKSGQSQARILFYLFLFLIFEGK